MKDDYYGTDEHEKRWYPPDKVMRKLTPDKIQWVLSWWYVIEQGQWPGRPLGQQDDKVPSKVGYYPATWENRVACIGWIRYLLEREGIGGMCWRLHLENNVSLEDLSKRYQKDPNVLYRMMVSAIWSACKRHNKR